MNHRPEWELPKEVQMGVPPRYPPATSMTLRDWFAGQALAGLCAHPNVLKIEGVSIQAVAYELADFMLKEREK
jgi:hypothetical protein